MADFTKITVDNTTYNVKDSTARSDISALNTYSTNETAIGKWHDNKTIYRKVFTATGNNSNAQGIGYLDNYDTIIHIEIWLKNGTTYRNGFANWYGSSSWGSQVYVNSGWVSIECGNDYASFKNGASITAVVEYTKN